MEIEIDYTKSAQQNAEEYFEKAKKARAKAAGAEESVKRLQAQLSEVEQKQVKAKIVRKVGKKEWYEKFNWFLTSDRMLAIGGKSAQQNELINSRHFEDNDLFFHANVFGASLVVLKDGMGAPPETRSEVAQFAACFSRAWESGTSAADVYAAARGQVSKSTAKGSLGTGSFLISGEKEWYRNTRMELSAIGSEGKPLIVPAVTAERLHAKDAVRIRPGGRLKKSDAAKQLCKILGFEDIDYIVQHLPNGSFSIG